MPSLFTRIINHEIPCTKVYEDEKCLAFLDISPCTKGHTLLVPKQEHVWMTDAPDELVGYMFIKAKELMQQMKDKLGCDFVRLYVEGTQVPHFHIHLIPSMLDDNAIHIDRTEYAEGEAEKIASVLAFTDQTLTKSQSI